MLDFQARLLMIRYGNPNPQPRRGNCAGAHLGITHV